MMLALLLVSVQGADCSCNTLPYPDRVKCCAAKPMCKFEEASYPTRPQGLCVPAEVEAAHPLAKEGEECCHTNVEPNSCALPGCAAGLECASGEAAWKPGVCRRPAAVVLA